MEPSTQTTSAIELQSVPLANAADDEDISASPPAEQYPVGIRFVILTIGLILSIFLAALDQSILATAIPRITDQFGTVKDVGWYGTGYAISTAAFQSSWGKAYKVFPLMRTFIAAVTIFELGNIVCALAQNSATLILGRLVAGLGGGGVMTGCFIFIAFSTKPRYRAAYMGILGVTFAVASVAGPLLGGFLTDGPGWRWCFWISLPIGAFAATVMALTFKTPASVTPAQISVKEKLFSLDLGGAFLVLGSLACFVLAMERAGVSSSWQNWRVVTSLCASAALLLLFIVNERLMGTRAMVQSHLLKNRRITVNLVYMFFLAGLLFPLYYALPIQFQSVNNASATQSGLRLIPLIFGVSVFTLINNGILTFWRHFTPMLVVGAVAATIGMSLVHTLDADSHVSSWIGYEIIIGMGVGTALQVPMIANQAAVGVEDMAAVTSMTLFAENVGTAMFTAATESAFTNGLVKALTQKVPSVNPEAVINTGATRIREAFRAEDIYGVLSSYLDGCRDSHLVPIACGASAIVVSMVVAVPAVAKEFDARVRKRT